MWTLLGVICIFLPRITFALEKCGVPAKPSHSQLRPEKPFYDHGDNVRVVCEENYVLFGKETSIQTCDVGVWLGKPTVCLQNLAYGRKFSHFGSPSGGQSKPHGGVFIHDVTNARDFFFFDLGLERSTTHAYIYFRGNFSVTDQNHNELPFEQIVLAFDAATDLYHPCQPSSSVDYYECISPDERSFTGAKAEITILNKSIDLTHNSIQVKLQIEKNGFIVLSLSDKDCGTPPIPLHGSVSMTANDSTARYTCSPGYTLHGKSVQKCDILKYPEITWMSRIPVCLERPKSEEVTSMGLNTIVIAVLSTVGCLAVILMLAWIIWFCRKRQAHNQTRTTPVPMTVLPCGVGVSSYGLNNANIENSTSNRSLPFPPTMTKCEYMTSRRASPTLYENLDHDYENIDAIR